MIKFAAILLIFPAAIACSWGGKEAKAKPSGEPYVSENSAAEQQNRERAEQVIKALAAAYPDRIEKAEFRDGDWAVLLRGTWYYYAEGRILPENLRTSVADYNPQPFYRYQSELTDWKAPSPEEAARYRDMGSSRSRNAIRRSQLFFDALWRISSRDDSYQRVKSIRLFGKTIMVHYSILEELSLVEETILAAAKTDPQVQAWVNNINTLDGWSWRNIADSQSRSFHSYGAAIDILPRSLGGKETYWLWASQRKAEWWNVSYNERYHPPLAVIKAFEKYGFIWGGSWLFFDTMHFEYRPEILILSGMKVETER